MSDLERILSDVSSIDKKTKGTAACDLAQLIWDGKLEWAEIQRLLLSDDRNVRGAVAWAIADLNGPEQGVAWLMRKGVHDVSDGVRYWALRCAEEMPEMCKLVSPEDIHALREDESNFVRRIALTLWPNDRALNSDGGGDE